MLLGTQQRQAFPPEPVEPVKAVNLETQLSASRTTEVTYGRLFPHQMFGVLKYISRENFPDS